MVKHLSVLIALAALCAGTAQAIEIRGNLIAVPEPATAMLLGLGICFLGLRRRAADLGRAWRAVA